MKPCAPEAIRALDEENRRRKTHDAITALVINGGIMRGRDLCRLIGMDERGLRRFLDMNCQGLVTIERHPGEGPRDEAWYRLNQPQPKELPPPRLTGPRAERPRLPGAPRVGNYVEVVTGPPRIA